MTTPPCCVAALDARTRWHHSRNSPSTAPRRLSALLATAALFLLATAARAQAPSRTPSRSPSRSPSHSPSHSPSRSPSRSPFHTPSPSHSPSRSPAPTPSPTFGTPLPSPSPLPGFPIGISFLPTPNSPGLPSVPHREFLLSNGYYADGLDFVFRPASPYEVIRSITSTPNNTRILTDWDMQSIKESQSYVFYNISLDNYFAGFLGPVRFTMTVTTTLNTSLANPNSTANGTILTHTYSISGSYLVGGVIVVRTVNGVQQIVSGENSSFAPGKYTDIIARGGAPYNFVVLTQPLTGQAGPNWSKIEFLFQESDGDYQQQVSYDQLTCQPNGAVLQPNATWINPDHACGVGFGPSGAAFFIVFNPYRVGTGNFFIDMVFPGFEDRGETYRQTINILIDMNQLPPPVFYTSYEMLNPTGGEVIPYTGFNFFDPPRFGLGPDNVTQFSWIVSGTRYPASDYVYIPEEANWVIFFSQTGKPSSVPSLVNVSVSWDIRYNTGLQLTPISYPSTSFVAFGSALPARDYANPIIPDPLFDVPGHTVYTFALRLSQYQVETYTVFKNDQIVTYLATAFRKYNVSNFTLMDVTSGSAVPTYYILANTSTAKDVNDTLATSVSSGSLQRQVRLAPSTVTVQQYLTPVYRQTQSRSSGGFPPWAIALIAIVGAVLIVGLIVCFLFVLMGSAYDESSSESESSEGVAGVPRPDDMFYQQGIIRDVYGRDELGDDPDYPTENGVRIEVPGGRPR